MDCDLKTPREKRSVSVEVTQKKKVRKARETRKKRKDELELKKTRQRRRVVESDSMAVRSGVQ